MAPSCGICMNEHQCGNESSWQRVAVTDIKDGKAEQMSTSRFHIHIVFTAGARCYNGDSRSSAVAGEHRHQIVLLQNHVGYAGVCHRKAERTLGENEQTFNLEKSLWKCCFFCINLFPPLLLSSTGVVQWDGVKAPLLHRCEECHPQDAGKQQCCARLKHRTQPVYSWTEMGLCLQQSPGAKGYLSLTSRHVSSAKFLLVPMCYCNGYSKWLKQRVMLIL